MSLIVRNVGLALAIALSFLRINFAAANNVDVSAAVPYLVPGQAATIDSSLDGLMSNQQSAEIFGTCQTVAPYSIVVIARQSVILASTACNSNGTYRVSVLLTSGQNEIIARTANLSYIYGPDSSPSSLVYSPPQPPPSPPASLPTITPATPSVPPSRPSPVANAPFTAPTSMNIVPDRPFEILDKSNSTQIDLEIKGGNNPYFVDVVWGDGSTQSLPPSDSARIVLKHTYAAPGKYQVRITVRDVLGSIATYFHTAVSTTAANSPAAPAKSSPATLSQSGKLYFSATSWKFWAIQILVWVIAFLMGFKYGRRQKRERVNTRGKGMLVTKKTSVLTKKKTLVILGLIIAAGVIAAAYSRFAGSPVEVSVSKPAAPAGVRGAQVDLKNLDTGLFSVVLPGSFQPKTSSETPDKPILASYLLAESYKSGSAQIGITVGRLDTGLLSDLAFIKQRNLEPSNYAQVTGTGIKDSSAVVIERLDGSEVAVFISNGNRYAALVVSGKTGQKEAHTATAVQVVNSWRWN